MTDDTQIILQELRVVRKLVINLTAEIISMKAVVAVAGKPAGMTVEQVIKTMDDNVRQLRNQLSEFDIEDTDVDQ